MPRLSFNTGNCALVDCRTSGFPQTDSRIGHLSTPLLVEEAGDATFDSNACKNHQESPYALRSHDCNMRRVLSRRSLSGEGSLWRSRVLNMDREEDFDGQSPRRTNTVASGENTIDYPNTGEKSSNASLRQIYTKRSKSGGGEQNGGGHGRANGPDDQTQPQGNDGANENAAEKDNGDPGANGNGDSNGHRHWTGNGNGHGNGNGDGPGFGNGNNANGSDNRAGNANGSSGTGDGTDSSGDSAGNTVISGAASSTGSGVDSATATSNSVGPTGGTSTPSTATSSPTPSETSNGNSSVGNAVGSASTAQGDSNGTTGGSPSATNQNYRQTALSGGAQSTPTQVPSGTSHPLKGDSGGDSSGESEVWTTISTVSAFTSTEVTVMTFTSGSSVFTATRSTTSTGVTTISIPTTVPANTAQRHSNSNVGTIVGALIGSILGCLLLLAALLWFRRRQQKRRSVGFLFLTPGPGQANTEYTNPHAPINMSQATDLQRDYARPGAISFPSSLSLPSIIDIRRGRSQSADGPDPSPYKPLSRASTHDSQLYLGCHENDLSIDSPHLENPFADPPMTQSMIDSLIVQSRVLPNDSEPNIP